MPDLQSYSMFNPPVQQQGYDAQVVDRQQVLLASTRTRSTQQTSIHSQPVQYWQYACMFARPGMLAFAVLETYYSPRHLSLIRPLHQITAFGSSSSSSLTLFSSHTTPVISSSSSQPNNIFLSHYSSSKLQLQPAERSDIYI